MKSAVDNSIACDKVITVTGKVSTNVTSTASINFDDKDKKVRLLYLVHVFITGRITTHNRYYLLSLKRL